MDDFMSEIIRDENHALRSELARVNEKLSEKRGCSNADKIAELSAENVILKTMLETKCDEILSLKTTLGLVHQQIDRTLAAVKGLENV